MKGKSQRKRGATVKCTDSLFFPPPSPPSLLLTDTRRASLLLRNTCRQEKKYKLLKLRDIDTNRIGAKKNTVAVKKKKQGGKGETGEGKKWSVIEVPIIRVAVALT